LQDKDGKDQIRSVSWAAPRLTDVALRYRKDQLYNVLVYGRAPVMPAWGTAGGGPVTDQTIYDLISYLRHKALEENDEARKIYEEVWDNTLDADKAFEAALNSEPIRKMRQAESTKQLSEAKKLEANADKSDGQILFEMNCARCHVAGWSNNEPNYAGNAFGPKLTTESLRVQFPDPATQAAFIKNGTEGPQKPYGTRGVNGYEGGGMPYFNNILTDKQIEAIVAYERSLGVNGPVAADKKVVAVTSEDSAK
jgi:mono/diheme cytochrome c family protein